MRLDLENLPSDIGLLHRLVRDMASVVETRDDEIGRLQRLTRGNPLWQAIRGRGC